MANLCCALHRFFCYPVKSSRLKIHCTVRNSECLKSRDCIEVTLQFKSQRSLFNCVYMHAIESLCVILRPIIRIKLERFLFVVIIFTSFFCVCVWCVCLLLLLFCYLLFCFFFSPINIDSIDG